MEAISAGETAEQLSKMRDTILRTKFTELQRNEERRKTQRLDISVETVAGLLPWREVVEPHQDVATGEFQQAEFAADLGKVHTGSEPAEERDPQQFRSDERSVGQARVGTRSSRGAWVHKKKT